MSELARCDRDGGSHDVAGIRPDLEFEPSSVELGSTFAKVGPKFDQCLPSVAILKQSSMNARPSQSAKVANTPAW